MPQFLSELLEYAIQRHGSFRTFMGTAECKPDAVIVAVESDAKRIDAMNSMWVDTTILTIEPRTGVAWLRMAHMPPRMLGQQSPDELIATLAQALSR